MADPAEGFKSLLIAANVAVSNLTADWSVHIGFMPDNPDRVVVPTTYGGDSPEPRWLLDYPRVQVRVRGSLGEYQATRSKMVEVQDVMLGFNPQNVNGDWWSGIIAPSGPTLIGWDENRRPVFSMNFNLFVEPASSALTNRDPL